MRTLERQAQRAAEQRLSDAIDVMNAEDDLLDHGMELSDPFCGCDTCVVREVIDAAWPYLKRLALVVEQADTSDSNSDAERHAGSNPAEGTYGPH